MTKKAQISLLISECKLWLHMSELTEEEKVQRVTKNLDEMQKLLEIPHKKYIVFGDSCNGVHR